jgi:hypothetical protein
MADGSRPLKPPRLTMPGPAHYEVGYRKPPAHARFGKGTSGNPKGRPKGSGGASAPAEAERLRAIIKAEAYRAIRVPDGGKAVTMTMAEAVVRSIAVHAAKGQARAQRLFTDLLHVTEQADADLYSEYLETMIQYKVSWEVELDRRARLGISGPEPLPHPDDILIDMRTGRAHIRGPMTREEKAEWDLCLAHRDGLQEDFTEELKLSNGRKNKAFWREQAVFTQHLYNRLNDRLWERFWKPVHGPLARRTDDQDTRARRRQRSADPVDRLRRAVDAHDVYRQADEGPRADAGHRPREPRLPRPAGLVIDYIGIAQNLKVSDASDRRCRP